MRQDSNFMGWPFENRKNFLALCSLVFLAFPVLIDSLRALLYFVSMSMPSVTQYILIFWIIISTAAPFLFSAALALASYTILFLNFRPGWFLGTGLVLAGIMLMFTPLSGYKFIVLVLFLVVFSIGFTNIAVLPPNKDNKP